jgi:primosomal protein N'
VNPAPPDKDEVARLTARIAVASRLRFARIIVLKPFVGGALLYAVPDSFKVCRGDLVLIPFGRLALRGIVSEEDADSGGLPVAKIKNIAAVLARRWLAPVLVDFGLALARSQFLPPGEVFLRFLPPQPESVLGIRYQRADTATVAENRLYRVLPEKPVTYATLMTYLRRYRIRKSLAGLIGDRLLRVSVPERDEAGPSETPDWREGSGFTVSWAADLPLSVAEESRTGQVLLVFPTSAEVEIFVSRHPDAPVHRHDSGATVRTQKQAWRSARSGLPGFHIAVQSGPFLPLPNLRIVVAIEEASPSYVTRERLALDIREACLIRAHHQKVPYIAVSRVPRLYLMLGPLTSGERARQEPLRPALPRATVFAFRSGRRSPYVTRGLFERLQEHYGSGEKVIFLVSARGEGYLACAHCGTVVSCPACGRTLRWSPDRAYLLCGFCRGLQEKRPAQCPECGSDSLRTRGITAARFHRELQHLTPEVPAEMLPERGGWNARRQAVSEFAAREGTAALIAAPEILGCDLSGIPVRVVVRGDSFWAGGEDRPPESGVCAIARFLDGARSAYLQVDGAGFSAVKSFESGDLSGFFEDERVTREALGAPPFSATLEVRIPGSTPAQAERRFRQWRALMGVPAADGDISGPAPGARTRKGLEYVWWLRTRSQAEMESLYASDAVTSVLRKLPARWRVIYR